MNIFGAADLAGNLPVPHEDGSFVNERIGRIAEILNEYDRSIEVRWIPPARRGVDDPGFAIVYSNPPQPEYVMFYVKDESEFDHNVIERVFQMDAEKHGNILSKMDAANLAVKAANIKKRREELEEAHEFAKTVFASKLHTYKHDGVTYT